MTTPPPRDDAPAASEPVRPPAGAARRARVRASAPTPRRGGGRGGRLTDAALVLLLGAALVQAYALVHEAGHALSALTVGVSVVGFDAWALGRPAVRLAGDLTGARGAWVSLGGALWPWLVTLLGAALWRPRAALLRLGALVWTSIVVASLLPWVVVPLAGWRPVGDDITLFLDRGGAPPWLVALGAAGAALALVVLAARAVGGPRGAWAAVRAAEGVGRRPWPWLAAVASALLVLLATEAGGRLFGAAATVLPPPGFHVAAEVGLRAGIGDDQLLGDEALVPHVLEVWVAVEGADTGPIQVSVVAPDGSRTPVLRLPVERPVGLASARSGSLALPAGPWAVVASAPRGAGRLVVAWRDR